MAKGVLTTKGREKLCKAHAGDITLPAIVKMAFGDGGTNAEGDVIDTTGEEVALRNELIRKPIGSHMFPNPTTCRYSVKLEKSDIPDTFISEVGLFDEEDDLVMYKTFLKKGKDSDMEFIFDLEEIFPNE